MPRRIPPTERRLLRKLAANVRRIREHRGISVQAASETVGMHWRLWQKVEAGDTNATLQTLVRLADALGVEARDLLA